MSTPTTVCAALQILSNGTTVHIRTWDTPGVTSARWQFMWTPPGEGIYRFETVIDDWAGVAPSESADAAPGERVADADGDIIANPLDDLSPRAYLPWVNAINASGGHSLYLPLVVNGWQPADRHLHGDSRHVLCGFDATGCCH